jgi:hypothetical protein
MAYSSDTDLQRYQPYVFEHGTASFAMLHDDAASEIIQRLRRDWLPLQRIIIPDLFDAAKLEPDQFRMISISAVLGLFILPQLAASIGGEGFLQMASYYRKDYDRRFSDLLIYGIKYYTGDTDDVDGYELIKSLPVSELQRRRA